MKQKKFIKCQNIQLNHYTYTDNGLLYYDKRPLSVRFKEQKKTRFGILKSILKGNLNINVNKDIHNLNDSLISCDGFGNINKMDKHFIYTKKPDFKFNYINHYAYKSTKEFINKLNKGSVYSGKTTRSKLRRIKNYFCFNSITREKIYLIEKYTNLNLSTYWKKLKNNFST